MIASVSGEVLSVSLTGAVVNVGGVGLSLHCTPNTTATLRTGVHVTLPTSLIVREDSLTLYAFVDEDERQTFELLQTASGVGPKVAQAMVAVMRPDAIRTAIASDDAKALTKVPGIGQKGAQRIILELKDRIGPAVGGATAAPVVAEPWRDQVQSGLVGLGWSARDAEAAVQAVVEAGLVSQPVDVATVLRAALQTLSRP